MTTERSSTAGAWAWAAVVVPLWVTLALCAHWEPVVRDGWSNVYWYILHKLDLGSAWAMFRDGWLGSNPRLGQTVTTLLYAPGPYHVIVTPVLELGLVWLMTTLALGRWPSVRRSDDAIVFATVVAVLAACTPQFGSMLFYRPFTGNYVFGLALNLAWLVPYRLHVASPRPSRGGHAVPAVGLFVLGVAAGMCNEHTGPGFIALGLVATLWSARAGHGMRPWLIAGLVGLVAGYVVLMVAPGHDMRYAGLARQAGIVGRIVGRSASENLWIVGKLGLYLEWAVPWLALGAIARWRAPRDQTRARTERAVLIALALASVAITLTLLGSPKLGPRLYLASVALAVIAVVGWVAAQLTTAWARLACAVLSGAVVIYVEVRCLATYARVGPVGARRLALIQDSPDRARVVVPRYPVPAGKWFIGEDLDAASLRQALANDYYLDSLELAPE